MKKSGVLKSSPTGAKNSTSSPKPLIDQQPQSKRHAAVQAGIFLCASDVWSNAYFNDGDLHCIERKLFASDLTQRSTNKRDEPARV